MGTLTSKKIKLHQLTELFDVCLLTPSNNRDALWGF